VPVFVSFVLPRSLYLVTTTTTTMAAAAPQAGAGAGAGADGGAERTYFCFVRYENNTFSIQLTRPDMLVRELKILLAAHDEIGVPVAQQQLIRSGLLMLDQQRLSEFHLMQSTVLHLIRRRVESEAAQQVPVNISADQSRPWVRPPYEPLPLRSQDLPVISRDVFESSKFFVWCTALTAPCFHTSAASLSTTLKYQEKQSHSPPCATEAECRALARHESIGHDSEGTPYPHELQPASARPRCVQCKNELVIVDNRAIQWDQVFARSVHGECMVCEISGPVIEVAFVCRGTLARSVKFSDDGLTRSVCRSYSTDGANVPVPNVYQQASSDRLTDVARVAELVGRRARAAITAATTAPVSLATVQEACLAAEQAARSIETGPPEVVANGVATSKDTASKLVALLRALQTRANPNEPLPGSTSEVTQLTTAAAACEAAARDARAEPVVVSSDTGAADMLQLEFHGCSTAAPGKPHRINANGLNRYIDTQTNVRSVMVRNDRIPHIFGAYVVRCCEPNCDGILYLPSCRLAGPERYDVLRNWSLSETTLQQGGVLCPLPNHRGDPAYLPPNDEPGPCRHCPACKDYFCEEHRQPWRSCLHNLDADGMVRHRINEALTHGSVQRCPNSQCGALVQRDNTACTGMKCDLCNTNFCYFCGKAFPSLREHNRDWETNSTRCPRFLDVHPKLIGTPIESLARFHHLKTLRLLRETRRAMEETAPGRFDVIFRTLPASLLTIEAQINADDGASAAGDSATVPPITLEMVQQPAEIGLPYAMP